jgi:hypothetical protein
LTDEGRTGQLSDILNKLAIRQAQAQSNLSHESQLRQYKGALLLNNIIGEDISAPKKMNKVF